MGAGNHSGTYEAGIARQLRGSDEPDGMVNHTNISRAAAKLSSNPPMFQVPAMSLFSRKRKESSPAFARNEAPAARVADIVPDFNSAPHRATHRLPALTRNTDRMRTRHKRVLHGCAPLTKEHSLQCLAAESLIRCRAGTRSLPSTRSDALLLAAEQVGVGRGGVGGGLSGGGRIPERTSGIPLGP